MQRLICMFDQICTFILIKLATVDNLPRLIFYSTGVFIISAAFTLLSSDFLRLLADPGWKGTAILLAYGLIYMNIVFVVSRRYMRRLEGPSPAPYIFGILVAVVPLVWIFIYEGSGLFGTQRIIFCVVIALACGLGAYFGHRAGLKAQIEFRNKLEEYLRKTGQLPDDLKRSHDNLNKN